MRDFAIVTVLVGLIRARLERSGHDQKKANNMTSSTQKPVETIRDGALSASIWKNSTDKGACYNVTFERVYTDDAGNAQNTKSFSSNDLLRIARLANKSSDRIAVLKVSDRAEAQQAA